MPIDDQTLLKKLNRRTRFTQFLVWIALFFTAVGIAAGYKNWLRIHQKAKAGLTGVAALESELPKLAKKKQLELLTNKVEILSSDGKEFIEGALKELRSVQDSTQHIADSVYSQIEALTLKQTSTAQNQAPTVQNWSLSEVRFLLEMGMQALQIRRDKVGAVAAFSRADQLLLKRGSIDLLPLRKQISIDLALISQYVLPEVSVLSNTIDGLLKELEPEIIVPEPSKLETTMKKDLDKEELLRKKAGESIVTRVKKTLNDAVVIKRFDKPLQEEMDALSKESLFQLLSLRLETLRLMLLQGRNENYHKQIKRIKELLKSYYSESKFTSLEAKLTKLADVNLSPTIPDISASLKLLDSLINEDSKKTTKEQ